MINDFAFAFVRGSRIPCRGYRVVLLLNACLFKILICFCYFYGWCVITIFQIRQTIRNTFNHVYLVNQYVGLFEI